MLENVLAGLRQKLDHSSLSGLNERNTDRVFVSPLLEALGYDLANLDETTAGYHLKDVAGGSDISYAFLNGGQIIMLLEIRPLYSDLRVPKNLSRVFAIARASHAPVLTISNGVEWHTYTISSNTMAPALIIRIDIRDPGAEVQLRRLQQERVASGELVDENTVLPVLNDEPISDDGPIKNRGYKISENTHKNLNRLRTRIMTQREVRDQEITNSMIVENVLKLFLGAADSFNHYEISNEAILQRRIEEALARRFAK